MLNEYQRAVVDRAANTRESIIIEAAPGAGKTHTLAAVSAALPRPQAILATSFIGKIVDELKEKLSPDIECRTLHSLGRGMLLGAFPRMSGEVDTTKAARHLLDELRARKRYVGAKTIPAILATVKLCKANLVAGTQAIESILADEGPWIPKFLPAELAEVLFAVLRRCGMDETAMDFDDMLWMPHVRGLSSPNYARYDTVLCDEINDFTPVQIGLSLNVARRFIGVGDGDQCLYAWNGADTTVFRRLPQYLNTTTLRLPLSYRCARSIVEEAQQFSTNIEALPNAPEGTVSYADIEEAAQAHIQPGDYVLCRSNFSALAVHADLTSRGVRAWIDGSTFRSKLESIANEAATRGKSPGRIAAEQGVAVDTIQCLDHMWAAGKKTESGFRELLEDIFTKNPDGAVVMTVHQAKGRQADGVHIISDTFESKQDDAKTRARLLYVAITRAQTRLTYVNREKPGA